MRLQNAPKCRCGTKMGIEAKDKEKIIFGCMECLDVHTVYK